MGLFTTDGTADGKRDSAGQWGMALSFLSLFLLDLEYLEWFCEIFAARFAPAVEAGSGDAQVEGGWVLKWMAVYTAIVVMKLHHAEHDKCRNHSFNPQMFPSEDLPCFANPFPKDGNIISKGARRGETNTYFVKGGGIAEIYGVPVVHALGNICLIIAKSYDLGGECPTPPVSESWSSCGQVFLAVSGVIADFF